MGERISQEEYQAKRKAGSATHVALIGNEYYDGSDVSKTVAGMANRAPKGQRNNLTLTKTGRLRANKVIGPGQELLLSYGSAYRL